MNVFKEYEYNITEYEYKKKRMQFRVSEREYQDFMDVEGKNKTDKLRRLINMNKSIKEKMENLTEIIESCWDENDPNDGKTFDERLKEKLSSEDYDLVTEDF